MGKDGAKAAICSHLSEKTFPYNPEAKHQCFQWKIPQTEIQYVCQAHNTKGIIHYISVPPQQIINQVFYL
jgi:hypothetical protein